MKNIFISETHRAELNTICRSGTIEARLSERAKIILALDNGTSERGVAKEMRMSRDKVSLWSDRWGNESSKDLSAIQILSDRERAGAPATFDAEQICQLVSLACQKPEDFGRPISHWTPRELADELISQKIVPSISGRHVGRLLEEGDIKPHLMRYYLHTEKDADFDRKVEDICKVYSQAKTLAEEGTKVISCDEMTGIQATERAAPDKPIEPGRVQRQEFNYIRHGTQCLIANFDVATGQVIHPTIAQTRTEEDFANHIKQLVFESPTVIKWHFVLDNLNTHQSETLVKFVAEKAGISEDKLGEKGKSGILENQKTRQAFLAEPNKSIVFHYTPKHASWLNQIEIWFSILVRKLLKRESFNSTENLKEKILAFIEYFNRTMAKPFKWTYKGRALSI